MRSTIGAGGRLVRRWRDGLRLAARLHGLSATGALHPHRAAVRRAPLPAPGVDFYIAAIDCHPPHPKEPTMYKRFSHRAAALGGAAVITMSVLLALDLLATRQPALGVQAHSAPATQQVLVVAPRATRG
jgi:hypothetical protein